MYICSANLNKGITRSLCCKLFPVPAVICRWWYENQHVPKQSPPSRMMCHLLKRCHPTALFGSQQTFWHWVVVDKTAAQTLKMKIEATSVVRCDSHQDLSAVSFWYQIKPVYKDGLISLFFLSSCNIMLLKGCAWLNWCWTWTPPNITVCHLLCVPWAKIHLSS